MLFDLRARGRRRAIKVIYLFLALLMGGGLIFFGIGGSTNGGLFDAFKSGGGGSGNVDSRLTKQVDRYRRAVRLSPQDAKAWAALTRAQYQVAGIGENYDQNAGTFTAKGRHALVAVEHSWDRYLALSPTKPDPDLAALMVQAFSPTGLSRPPKAVAAQELVVDARPPSAGLYSTLAVLAYAAGQTRKGDLAAGKAVSLAPKDQRASLKDQLAAQKSAATGAGSSTATAPSSG
jgi:hypothetical protein